jgi:hypothetical protein
VTAATSGVCAVQTTVLRAPASSASAALLPGLRLVWDVLLDPHMSPALSCEECSMALWLCTCQARR